ncbi:MAG: hypothetical protein NTV01_10795 [Bacteroidia bacterium]|nr:hypothetical protein [Bacteroidia bacterium]
MKLSFVTKLFSFNPTALFDEKLRVRKLLQNTDVIRMLRVAYLYGELKQGCTHVDPGREKEFTFDKALDEIEKG